MHRARAFAAFTGMALTLIVATSTPADAYPRPGRTERVSVTSYGTEVSGGHGQYPSISDDGRYVAFHTFAAMVPEDTNELSDTYVRDRLTGTTERVSTGANGEQGDGHSGFAQISGNG